MIIKNIFKIHYLFYLVAFICIITGFFKPFVFISLLIIVHELGHYITALYYKWKIDKIIIFPFGGVTLFNDHLNKPIKEEFMILIMGPLFQVLFYFLVTFLFGYNTLFTKYHYALLIFNLLPIFPLDGSKLIHLLFDKCFAFKKSHLLTMILSLIVLFVSLVFIFINQLNLVFVFLFLLLFIKVINEIKLHNEIFNKFLMERYLYNFNFKKTYIINGCNVSKMHRDYKHLFLDKNKYHTEKSILQKRFDFKRKL